MSIPLEFTDPSEFDRLPIYSTDYAQVLINGVDEEREENATQGNPDACGEGFRYNGPNRLFVSETRKYGKLLIQIEGFGGTDGVAIQYNVWGRVEG
jgi:hypothetical protein